MARFGGEELCLLVPGLDVANVSDYFETLRERISALRVRDETLSMTLSIGVCIASEGDQSLHHLLNEADKHLYLAKAGGRNQIRVAS